MSAAGLRRVAPSLLPMLALSLALAGCGKTDPNVDQLLASGKAAQAARRHNAAIIQFKNVVQMTPNHGEARYLLAVEYQRTGDLAAAEKELRQARSLGYDDSRVAPALGRVLLAMGEHQKLLDEPPADAKGDPRIAAGEIARRASAMVGLKRRDEAAKLYAKALAIDPGAPEALIGQATLALGEGDLDTATRLVERTIASTPDSIDAWIMKADLLRYARSEDAYAAYQKAIDLDPDNIVVRMNLVSMHLDAGSTPQAEAQLAEARKVAPRSALVKFMEALIHYRKGDYFAASGAIDPLLEVANDHMPSVLLAGAIEYAKGSYPRARTYLTRVVERMPQNIFARELLASSLAASGNPEGGFDVLRSALAQAPDDPQLLRIAGNVAIQNNDPLRASELFERAARIDPKNASARTGLGASRLAAGDTERALADLEAAVKLDSNTHQADFLLVMAQLQRGRFDAALKAVQSMESKQPDNPLTHNLKAGAYLGKRDRDAARKALERAIELDPSYAPATLNLAQLDLGLNDARAARERLDAFLERNPDNVKILLAMAELGPRVGATPEERIGWLERAQRAAPSTAGPSLLLARNYAQAGDYAKAQQLAAQARSAYPDSVDVLDTQAAIQLAAGDRLRAIDTYGRMVFIAPSSALARYRLGNALALNEDYFGAANALRRALELRPDYVDAMALLGGVEIKRGWYPEAMKIARDLQKRQPKSPLGYRLEGDVSMAEKKYLQAVRSYETAFGLARSNALVFKIHEAYVRAGKRDSADARLAQWIQAAPSDIEARLYAAGASLNGGRLKEAIEKYEWLRDKQPGDVVVLNNLAWAYQQVKDARALPTAEHAYRLKPERPEIADTYGWMLVESGDARRGVDVLEGAVKGAPGVPVYGFHLAQGWAKLGERDKAREALGKILSAKTEFAERGAAVAMLEELDRGR